MRWIFLWKLCPYSTFQYLKAAIILVSELIKRLLNRGLESGRADDQNESIIAKRINEYNTKTAPLKDYYSRQGKFHSIHGTGTIDDIFSSLSKVITSSVK